MRVLVPVSPKSHSQEVIVPEEVVDWSEKATVRGRTPDRGSAVKFAVTGLLTVMAMLV